MSNNTENTEAEYLDSDEQNTALLKLAVRDLKSAGMSDDQIKSIYGEEVSVYL